MTAHGVIVVLVIIERLAELALSRYNTRRLLAAGAIEAGAAHYPLMVILHGSWLAAVGFGVPREPDINMILLAVFIVLQGARLWVIMSLGRRWTTRIIVLPGAALVRCGPYRYLRHPNYLVVAGEIAVLPMVFGAWEMAVAFSIANAMVLIHRIKVEEAALGHALSGSGSK